MSWINEIREGLDFSGMPEKMSFQDVGAVASLIDGFHVTGGVLESFAIGTRVVGDILHFGVTRASALDVWITLHAWYHAHRRGGLPPTDEDAVLLRRLVRHLREALIDLTPGQKAGIMSTLVHRKAAVPGQR